MPARDIPHLADPDNNPSFTKGVFLGEIREDLVFPFPTLADDERESLRMILGSLHAFAADHVDSKQLDHDGKFPDAVRTGIAENQWSGFRNKPCVQTPAALPKFRLKHRQRFCHWRLRISSSST